LDLLKLSIEGREEIHDRIRGKGSFKKVLQAVEIAQKQGIKFVFNSVLTAYNLDQIDFLISLAEKYKTGIRFTALNLAHAGRAKIEPLFPDKKDYQKAIGKLIEAKKRGRPVLNSFAGLKYLESWPKPQPIPCFASRAFAHLSAEGKLYPCVALEGKLPGKNVMELGFSKAFDTLPIPIHLGGEAKVRQEQTSEVLQTQYTSEVKLGKAREDTSEVGERCPGCWCGGTLELNLLFSLKPRAMLNLRKLI
jgi:MoaA/NifB/PqqE/SkfB family radical SAM enzyme